MVREAFTVTIGAVAPSLGRAADPTTAIAAVETARAAAVALQPDPTAFEAALATLVADGASPTQAHVTATNNAYNTLKTAQTAYVTAVNAISTTAATASVAADVALLFNAATVITKRALRAAIYALLPAVLNNATTLTE